MAAVQDMGELFRTMGDALVRHADHFAQLQAKVAELQAKVAELEVNPEEAAKTTMDKLFDEYAQVAGSVCSTSLFILNW